MAKKKPVIGRPPIDAEQRKSFNITFRARQALRERLIKAAELAGRSMSEEIEHRLEMSFGYDAQLHQAVERAENLEDIARTQARTIAMFMETYVYKRIGE